MNFKELLEKCEWCKIAEVFRSFYKCDKEAVKYYKKIYFRLLSYKPKDNEESITIIVDSDPNEYYDITGVNEEGRFGLDFTPWREWLGFNVKVEDMSNEEYVAHCLDEMTFYGDEDETEESLSKIEGRITDFENNLK